MRVPCARLLQIEKKNINSDAPVFIIPFMKWKFKSTSEGVHFSHYNVSCDDGIFHIFFFRQCFSHFYFSCWRTSCGGSVWLFFFFLFSLLSLVFHNNSYSSPRRSGKISKILSSALSFSTACILMLRTVNGRLK